MSILHKNTFQLPVSNSANKSAIVNKCYVIIFNFILYPRT